MNNTLIILVLSQTMLNILIIALIITVNKLDIKFNKFGSEFLKLCKLTLEIDKDFNERTKNIDKEYTTIRSVLNILLDRTNPKNKV